LDQGEKPSAPFLFDPGPACHGLPDNALDHAVLVLASHDLDVVVMKFGVCPDRLSHPWAVTAEESCPGDLVVYRRWVMEPNTGRLQMELLARQGIQAAVVEFPHVQPRGQVAYSLAEIVGVEPRRVGNFIATGPAPYRLSGPSVAAMARKDADDRPTVLVHLPFLAMGGAEVLTVEILRRLTAKFRFVVFTTESQPPEIGSTIREFESLTPHVYRLEQIAPSYRHTELVLHLAKRFQARSLFVANGSSWFYNAIASLHAARPDLWIINQVFDHCMGWIERYDGRMRRYVHRHVAPNGAIYRAYRQQYGLTADQSRLIYHGIDPAPYDPNHFPPSRVRELRRRFGLPEDRFIVAFLGRLHPQKRPLDFLAIAGRLANDPRFHFFMVGDGPLAPRIKDLTEHAPQLNFTRLPFTQPFAEVVAAIDALCITSEYEGLPLVLLHSLAMNKHIVSTDVGCIAEVLADGLGQVVPVGDIDGLVAGIRWSAANPPPLRGRDIVLAKFHIDQTATAYAETFLPQVTSPQLKAA
jgi:glycosyltransferase involved in cell wall biosynthesis